MLVVPEEPQEGSQQGRLVGTHLLPVRPSLKTPLVLVRTLEQPMVAVVVALVTLIPLVALRAGQAEEMVVRVVVSLQ